MAFSSESKEVVARRVGGTATRNAVVHPEHGRILVRGRTPDNCVGPVRWVHLSDAGNDGEYDKLAVVNHGRSDMTTDVWLIPADVVNLYADTERSGPTKGRRRLTCDTSVWREDAERVYAARS